MFVTHGRSLCFFGSVIPAAALTAHAAWLEVAAGYHETREMIRVSFSVLGRSSH